MLLSTLSAQVIPGRNVNMVAGTDWPGGDPFLQRQNEPSIAVSTRNDQHLLAGANDYRTVDLPGDPSTKPSGDAWLGVFKSLDGGKTWTSTLLPGYPQDSSGTVTPLRGYDAGADPAIRAGSNGLFFYSGIVFQRAVPTSSSAPLKEAGDEKAAKLRKEKQQRREKQEKKEKREREKRERAKHTGNQIETDPRARPEFEEEEEEEQALQAVGSASAVFVSTFMDLNNRENGDPISYVRTSIVDQDAGTRFLDKNWIAVDIPRSNSSMCTLAVPQPTGAPVLQSFPGGRVYVVYTAFIGPESDKNAQIMISYSANCGETWSRPRNISMIPDPDVNDDGVTNNNDLNLLKGVVGKRCGDPGFLPAYDQNQDCIINLLDLTNVSRNLGKSYSTVRRVPQGATIAIHPLTGAVTVAWREFRNGALPDAIQAATSTDFGATFTTPITVATFRPFDQGTTNGSFRSNAFPTIAADGARVYLAWAARGFASVNSGASGESRIVMSTSANGTNWTAPVKVDEPNLFGHQFMPALTFGAGKLTLIYYDVREDKSGLFQDFIDETAIFDLPTPTRHTVDVRIAQADPAPVPVFKSEQLSEYAFGAFPGSSGVEQLTFNPPNIPLFKKGTAPFHGDYIDVATAPSMTVDAAGVWSFNLAPSTSAGGYAVWTDNRNVRAGAGGSVTGFTPPQSAARGTFSVFDPTIVLPPCQPDLTGTRNQDVFSARFDAGLSATIPANNKPLDPTLERGFPVLLKNSGKLPSSFRLSIASQPVGGAASFLQFGAPFTSLDVMIPRRSSIARTVYATSSDPKAVITINIDEIDQVGGSIVAGGVHTSMAINADPTNPSIENPAGGNDDINLVEVYNPAIENPAIENPAIENPAIENPAIENPAIENVPLANRRILNPAIENPAIENPAIENPAIENPAIENTTLDDGSITDTTWTLVNRGNTAAVYGVRLLLQQLIPNGFFTQLIVHQNYTTPATDPNCELKVQLHNQVLVNITAPEYRDAADPDLDQPNIEDPSPNNATIVLAPGESVSLTLRVFDPDKDDAITFTAATAVTPAAVAQSVNTVDVIAGSTTPPSTVALTILVPALIDAVVGQPYSQTVTANAAGSWAVTSGAVPPGLTAQANGTIAGIPTTPGTYPFTLEITDTSVPPRTASRQYVIHVGAPLAFVNATVPDGASGQPYTADASAIGGVAPLTYTLDSGTLPGGAILGAATGQITSASLTTGGPFSFTVRVTDSAAPAQTATRNYSMTVHTAGATDLVAGLTDTPDPVDEGDPLTYSATVLNAGANAAINVSLVLTLPAGVTFTSADPGCVQQGTLVTCTVGTLLPSELKQYDVVIQADPGGTTLVATATVTTTSGDTNAANDDAVAQTTVNGTSSPRVWVANAGSTTAISVIDPATNSPDGTITLPSEAFDVDFSPNGARAYVVHNATDTVSVIDTSTNLVVATLSDPAMTSPVHVEVTPDGSRVLVVSEDGSVSIWNGATNGFIAAVAVGSAPNGLAISPSGARAFVANRNSDSVSVIDIASATVTNTILLASGFFPVELAVSPNGRFVYATSYFLGVVTTIDAATFGLIGDIAVGFGPQGVAATPDGRRLYVANFDEDTVAVVDTTTGVLLGSIPVSGNPNGIVVSPNGDRVYVTSYNGNEISVISTASNTVLTTVATDSLPIAVDYVRKQ